MATMPPTQRPPKDHGERPKQPATNYGLVSEKDLTIKFLEFKNEFDRKFADFRSELEKRFNDIEKRFNELERRMDVLQLKTTFILWALGAMFAGIVSGGWYIIKLLLDLRSML